jgi:hypothetical protein
MSLKESKERAKAAVMDEVRRDAEREALMKSRLRSWKRRTLWLGIALAVCTGAIAPFSDGMPLHQSAGRSTTFLVYLAMCLLSAFMYSAGTVYVVWKYLKDTRRINRACAPPGSKNRAGS